MQWPVCVLLCCDAVHYVKLPAVLPLRAGFQHRPHALQKRDHKCALQAGPRSNWARRQEVGGQAYNGRKAWEKYKQDCPCSELAANGMLPAKIRRVATTIITVVGKKEATGHCHLIWQAFYWEDRARGTDENKNKTSLLPLWNHRVIEQLYSPESVVLVAQ